MELNGDVSGFLAGFPGTWDFESDLMAFKSDMLGVNLI